MSRQEIDINFKKLEFICFQIFFENLIVFPEQWLIKQFKFYSSCK